MGNDNYVRKLENVIKQMIVPLKDIPFNLVIEAMTGKKVLSFNRRDEEHIEILQLLRSTALHAGREINQRGIFRSRPNEVGNDIEPYVRNAMSTLNIRATIPEGPSGKRKSTGYPDILFWYRDRPYYLECKTYNINNVNTTQRSFYFSPSDEFKVIYDAPHLMMAFEIHETGEQGRNHIYKCRNFKILSLESLSLDVKFEFNSDNRRMYSGKHGAVLLGQGEIVLIYSNMMTISTGRFSLTITTFCLSPPCGLRCACVR